MLDLIDPLKRRKLKQTSPNANDTLTPMSVSPLEQDLKTTPQDDNIDMRRSVPYFLLPAPPPAMGYSTEMSPQVPGPESYAAFVPPHLQYMYPPPHQQPPPMMYSQPPQGQVPFPPPQHWGVPPLMRMYQQQNPHPMGPGILQTEPSHLLLHHSQQPALTSSTNTKGSNVPPNDSLKALAAISELVGHIFSSSDFQSINETILNIQFEKFQVLLQQLAEFGDLVQSQKPEIVPVSQLSASADAAQTLFEVLRDWRDAVADREQLKKDGKAPKEPQSTDENELQDDKSGSLGSLTVIAKPQYIIFGLDDPNIDLSLTEYNAPQKKDIDLSVTANLDAMHKYYTDTKEPSGTCDQCRSTETIQWRKGPNGERSLCNACGLFYARINKKIGSRLSALILAQRKYAGFSQDRNIPKTLISEKSNDMVPFYQVEFASTGRIVEINYANISKLDFFQGDPPRLTVKIILRPLLDRVDPKFSTSNVNSKYDPSHDVKHVKDFR